MTRRNKHKLSGAIAETGPGQEINELHSTVAVISEQPYAAREHRRHARGPNGAHLNIAKDKQPPALNEPYRKPAKDTP